MNSWINEIKRDIEELRKIISKIEKEGKVGLNIKALFEIIFYNLGELEELFEKEKRRKLDKLKEFIEKGRGWE